MTAGHDDEWERLVRRHEHLLRQLNALPGSLFGLGFRGLLREWRALHREMKTIEQRLAAMLVEDGGRPIRWWHLPRRTRGGDHG